MEMTISSRLERSFENPRRFDFFVQELQTVQVTFHGRTPTRIFVKFIVFTLNEIFEDIEMTISSRLSGSIEIPRHFDFFVQVFEAFERTAPGSICTHQLINRTLICDAILYHFHVTSICGRTERPFIPFALFHLSRPFEQLEFNSFERLSRRSPFRPIQSATSIDFPTQTLKSISMTFHSL